METKHTPGPWWLCIDDSGDRPVSVPSVQAPRELDCAIVHWDGFWQEYWQSARGGTEMMANAHLIAAAPELLEALREVYDWIHNWNPNFTQDDEWATTSDKMDAAIDKALGK